MHEKIELVKGDITRLSCDAIVNAANESLLGGGGVDAAIHRVAGPELLNACRKLKGCETGQAKITRGFNLSAKFVVHTVGPVWQGGSSNERELLESSYQQCLEVASENGIRTIAFPNISTGVYHFPKALAAEIAIFTVTRFLEESSLIRKVTFVCFDDENYVLYKNLLNSDY